MKKIAQKDKKNRYRFQKFEIKQFILKIIISNQYLTKYLRWNVCKNHYYIHKNSRIKIVNKCISTKQKKKVNKYKYSRIQFRMLTRRGRMYGFRKGCW